MKRLEEKHEALLKEKEVNIITVDKSYACLLLVFNIILAILRLEVTSVSSSSVFLQIRVLV